MKRIIWIFLLLMLFYQEIAAQVSLNTTAEPPDNSAMLDISSTIRGMLVPRMTSTQRDAIVLPASGLLIYQSDIDPGFYFNAGTPFLPSWKMVGYNAGMFSQWITTGSDIYYNTGNVGIGTSLPSYGLHVVGRFDHTELMIETVLNQGNDKPALLIRNGSGENVMQIHSDAPGNTFVGLETGKINTYLANVQGERNTFIGCRVGYFNATGSNNTGLGAFAMHNNASGNGNAAAGIYSLYSNESGSYNTGYGWATLYHSRAGSNATAIGHLAMHYADNTPVPYTNNNVAVGYEALMGSVNSSSNTGTSNTALGYQALNVNSSGFENTASGNSSLLSNTTGVRNTATGSNSLRINATGLNNSSFGANSMYLNESGTDNTVMGMEAAYHNLTGSYNTVVGSGALFQNKAGQHSTAIGYQAMYNAYNTSIPFTNFNQAFGYKALEGSPQPDQNTGNFNTATGYEVLAHNSSGSGNTGSGYLALYNNTGGNSNSAYGNQALYENQNGFSNTAVGINALYTGDGNSNTAIGWNAGYSNGSGSSNTYLGYGTTSTAGPVSNATAIGSLASAGASNSLVLGSINGVNGALASVNVGIGTTTPFYTLDVYGSITAAGSFNNQALSTDYYGVIASCYNTPYYGIGIQGKGGWMGVIGTATLSGSGARYGVKGEGGNGAGSNFGVYGVASGGSAAYGIYGEAYGASASYAGYFAGNVTVTGILSKGGGAFKIDHPMDPAHKYLYHSFVESPDMMNVYNGNVTTDEQGEAVVILPDYFEALNSDYRYQLTVIGETFARAIISNKIADNSFKIRTDHPNIEVSWQVTGIRKDPFAEANRIPVEVDKEPENDGKYLHWKEWGKSPEDSFHQAIAATSAKK